jgi:sensor c-di-GMP phosphodiesterase-like protein
MRHIHTLDFVRRDRESGLLEYIHHFGTGWQSLLFRSREDADKFIAAARGEGVTA